MGLLDKVKNILFDEEEVEIPEIKKESRKKTDIIEEDTNPIKEIKVPKEDFSDREYKSESTFTFPIDFEDEEPDYKEEKEEILYKEPVIKKEPPARDFSDFLNKRNEKKKFKPTPIISPVYGVLDQNYKKEDVIVKESVVDNNVSLDTVRKKAFGSLEDELEQNLVTTKEIKVVKTKKIKEEPKKEEVVVEEPVDKLKTIGELIEEDAAKIDIPDIPSINDEDSEYNKDEVIEAPTKDVEDLFENEEVVDDNNSSDIEIDDDEADLFSLIDSMYEEKGE